jgi:hypothetical protein
LQHNPTEQAHPGNSGFRSILLKYSDARRGKHCSMNFPQ